MGKILLTRPQKLSQKIAQDLAKKNLSSLIQPLFSIIKLDNLQLPSTKLQAVIITSQNAVFALQKLGITKDILILAIGNKTALEVNKLGYSNALFANNSATSLFNLAKKTLTKNNAQDDLVLYLSGEIITLDLARKLQDLGFLARRMVVYKTKESIKLLPATVDEIANGNVAEIWFYSKRTIEIFYKLAKEHNLLKYLEQIKILCFSKAMANFAKKIGFLNINIIKK